MMKHTYSGRCAPDEDGLPAYRSQKSFSVSVYLPVISADGLAYKRSKAKVRIRGPIVKAREVYRKAQEVARELDAGRYAGPKSIVIV